MMTIDRATGDSYIGKVAKRTHGIDEKPMSLVRQKWGIVVELDLERFRWTNCVDCLKR
jgi:hypothetical protein